MSKPWEDLHTPIATEQEFKDASNFKGLTCERPSQDNTSSKRHHHPLTETLPNRPRPHVSLSSAQCTAGCHSAHAPFMVRGRVQRSSLPIRWEGRGGLSWCPSGKVRRDPCSTNRRDSVRAVHQTQGPPLCVAVLPRKYYLQLRLELGSSPFLGWGAAACGRPRPPHRTPCSSSLTANVFPRLPPPYLRLHQTGEESARPRRICKNKR